MQFIQTHSARLSLVGLLIALLAVLGVFAAAWSAIAALLFVFALALFLTFLVLWHHRIEGQQRGEIANATLQVQQQNALLETCEAAWCLFNREGLLLKSNLYEKALLDNTLRHFDDLVAVFDDSAPLIEQFRQLQKTGAPFEVQLTTVVGDQTILLKGERTSKHGSQHYCVLHMERVERPVLPTQVVEGAVLVSEIVVPILPAVTQTEQILDDLPFPLWLRDKALRLVWVNSAYATWCSSSRADVVARQLELFTPVPAKTGTKTLDGKMLAEIALREQKAQQERAYCVVGAERRLLSYTEMPLVGAANPVHVLLGMAQDVTKASELETELQRHISAHHEVLENMGSPITIYGADQRLEFYNRAYVRLWDHEEEFLASKPTFSEILEDLRTRRRAPEQVDFLRYKRERTALFTSLIEAREDMLHLPDGTTLRVVAVPHPFGGLMFLHEDVTDKLALESSYNTLIAVQRETLDNLAEGIAVFGADGKLKLFNPAYARIWHLETESLVDEPHINDLIERIKSLIAADQWLEIRQTMIACALDRSPLNGRFEHEDGTIISYSTVPLPDGAMLNSYVDITDTLKVEQALRESNAALATADRLKSEFVANVSYQLRTPLNTIMGFAEILANQYFGTLNERQLEYAKTMMESSKRLKLLIDDVIDLAMVDAGRMALNRRSTEIVPLLQTVAGMMGEWSRQQSLDLTVDAEDGIGSFEVDDKRIKQVLFNLISNAIQYTPPGGHITLQARRDGTHIRLSVIDTGIGIPQHDQDRIWHKFERSNPQTRQGGVGLGLSLVKSFIELHHGHIEITSAINQGTQITCVLPVQALMIEGTARALSVP
jgi:signal transduction histidine kinase/Ca2+/Na+ antiporter